MNLSSSPSAADSQRLFIALWLPKPLADAAWRRLERLRPDSRGIRWVKPDQLHLTLKFLGETPSRQLPALEQQLAAVAAASKPLAMALGPGGVFPPAGPPRVVWLGLEPARELSLLASQVESALAPLGFPTEKGPYAPHLTLGRAEPGAEYDRGMLTKAFDLAPATVESLSLVQSQLRPSGAVYTTVREWRLGG